MAEARKAESVPRARTRAAWRRNAAFLGEPFSIGTTIVIAR
jgi:hypothetical protein